MTTKITSANIDTTSVATATSVNTGNFNIALLGFKMAITEGLTVFNLIDGIVDEFEDESGTDGSASTNLTYNSTDDYYINSTQPNGVSLDYSAGFTTTSITEPDTSVTGTNPAQGSGTFGTFTVPTAITSVNMFAWGAGAMGYSTNAGGGGGFASGTLAVTPGQVMEIVVGEQGEVPDTSGPVPSVSALGGGGPVAGNNHAAAGGGASFVITNDEGFPALQSTSPKSPQVFLGAGGGGGASFYEPSPRTADGGAGGGLTGQAGSALGAEGTATQNSPGPGGGGGGQTSGGQGGTSPATTAQSGQFLLGGQGQNSHIRGGSGGGGFWGGGGAVHCSAPPSLGGAGGGSSYYGHPQITSGSTEGGLDDEGGGLANPNYVAGTNEGSDGRPHTPGNGAEDGYVLLSVSLPATATSSTIISDPFTANTVPTTTRIVVFEENVGSPTLNTDIIASVSRNGGSNFTTVTLTDSGYVTGSSGQRILTGQASVSGQPSGQSMKWKLELANQTVKIHGVSLQWS